MFVAGEKSPMMIHHDGNYKNSLVYDKDITYFFDVKNQWIKVFKKSNVPFMTLDKNTVEKLLKDNGGGYYGEILIRAMDITGQTRGQYDSYIYIYGKDYKNKTWMLTLLLILGIMGLIGVCWLI